MNYKKKRTVRIVVGVVMILIGLIFFGASADFKNEYQDVGKQTANVLKTGKIDHTAETEMYIAIVFGAVLVGFGVRLIVKKPKVDMPSQQMQGQYMQYPNNQNGYQQQPYMNNQNGYQQQSYMNNQPYQDNQNRE